MVITYTWMYKTIQKEENWLVTRNCNNQTHLKLLVRLHTELRNDFIFFICLCFVAHTAQQLTLESLDWPLLLEVGLLRLHTQSGDVSGLCRTVHVGPIKSSEILCRHLASTPSLTSTNTQLFGVDDFPFPPDCTGSICTTLFCTLQAVAEPTQCLTFGEFCLKCFCTAVWCPVRVVTAVLYFVAQVVCFNVLVCATVFAPVGFFPIQEQLPTLVYSCVWTFPLPLIYWPTILAVFRCPSVAPLKMVVRPNVPTCSAVLMAVWNIWYLVTFALSTFTHCSSTLLAIIKGGDSVTFAAISTGNRTTR